MSQAISARTTITTYSPLLTASTQPSRPRYVEKGPTFVFVISVTESTVTVKPNQSFWKVLSSAVKTPAAYLRRLADKIELRLASQLASPAK